MLACRAASEPDLDVVASLLGLTATERSWLEGLTPEQLSDLRRALERPGGESAEQAARLAFAVLGQRSRTFAFVNYPQVENRRTVCDGLLTE
jgi:hypothetical protein